MIDKIKYINYWKEGSISDMETAEILLEKNKLKECLFFCHLSIEKAFKSLYVQQTDKIPPRTHNLLYLSDKLGLNLENLDVEFLGILMKYQIEGRYPDYKPELPAKNKIPDYLQKSKEIQKWLLQKLSQ